MELVLWRHADAEPGADDMRRNLTPKGRKQAIQVAAWLRPRLKGPWKILVSPAERAKQTADALEFDYDLRPALGPFAAEDQLIREAGWPANGDNVLLVGHQPTLGRVAARLLTGRPGDLSIKKGAVWWFRVRLGRYSDSNETILRAVMTPDIAG